MSTTEVPEKTAPGTTEKGRVLQLANPLFTGPDVKEAQQLLTSNKYGNFHPGEIDGEYGELTAGAVRRAKWTLGYPDEFVNQNLPTALPAVSVVVVVNLAMQAATETWLNTAQPDVPPVVG